MPEIKTPRLDPVYYYDAIGMIQDASNMGGVVGTLAHMLTELNKKGADTKTRHSDPAVICVIAKLADLAGLDYAWPKPSEEDCKELGRSQPERDHMRQETMSHMRKSSYDPS